MPNYIPDDLQAQQEEILRRQKYAEMLQQQGMEGMPQGQMRGDVYVPPSWTQQLAQAIKGPMGVYAQREATNQQKALAAQIAQRKQDWLGQMPQASQSQEMFAQPDGTQMGPPKIVQKDPTSQDYLNWSMKGMQVDPQMAQFGMSMADKIENRQQRMQELQLRLQDQRLTAQERMAMQKQLAEMNIQGRQDLARIAASMRQPAPLESVVGSDGKPVLVSRQDAIGKTPYLKTGKGGAPNGGLPTQALKLQQEELDAIGTASSIKADLNELTKQIDAGKLTPSLINNTVAMVRNYTNNSTDESRNIASYQATLEKLRNDSLRLNKGTQTEGDSERAWNEIIKNSNDTEFVKKRLKEVAAMNERAANIRKMNVDVIRSNYGLDPMDVTDYKNQPAAVGSVGKNPARRATDKSGSVVDFSSLPP